MNKKKKKSISTLSGVTKLGLDFAHSSKSAKPFSMPKRKNMSYRTSVPSYLTTSQVKKFLSGYKKKNKL